MSPTSRRWIRTLAVFGAALVAILALKLPLREEAGAETAALCVFMFVFVALIAIGLLMDSLWSSATSEMAAFEHVTKEEWLTKP